MGLELVTLLVEEYEPAIEFFTDAWGFDLVDNSAVTTPKGKERRRVVVKPPGGGAGFLLTRADGPKQAAVVGRQFAGPAGLHLRVEDLDGCLAGARRHRCKVVRKARERPDGRGAVVRDPWGNTWNLLEA